MSHAAPDIVTITVDAPGVANIPPLESVGKIYEIGINGIGYMLDDHPGRPDSLPLSVVPSLDAPRLATGDTPFSQAVERYTLETFHDWTAGAGQEFLNREESDSRSFLDSDGVDPFTEKGKLKLLPVSTVSLAEAYAGLRLVAVGDDLYALSDDDELTRFVGSTSTWGTPFTISDGDPVVVSDLSSDGQFWYAATGEGIIRGTTADPAANWSAQVAQGVRWAGGRICAAVVESGSTPNRFTTLARDGTEELAAGHLTLDAGHTIVLGGAAAGSFYFGSHVGDQGQIWAWQLGVDSEGSFFVPHVAWDMPQGLVPSAVYAAAGEVWVRAYRAEGPSAGEVLIYRGVPGSGLTPFLVAELGVTARAGDFAEVGDLILFSWQDTTGDAGLGAVNLPTGGYSRWLQAHETGVVSSVIEHRGLAAYTVAGEGVYVESSTVWELAGFVTQSFVDGGSALDKVLDAVTIEAATLLEGEEVEVEYSIDGGGSYVSGLTLDTQGARRKTVQLSQRTGSWGLRVRLVGDGTSQTTLVAAQGKYHPLGLTDRIVVHRIRCYDEQKGLNGAPLPENGKGHGARSLRHLESLGQNRVLLQDVDWHVTGFAEVVEVVSVQVSRSLIYDPAIGENRVGGVAEVTFRKVG
jgi:hypothetical protein